jgi:molecular chaperone GrpE
MADQKPVDQDVQPEDLKAAPPSPEKAPEPNYYEQLLKLKAEFENFRKRTDREKPEFYKAGRADMLLRLLPVYDLLRKAHIEVQASHGETQLAKGMEMIFKEFEKLFKEEGVCVMEPVGKPYDAQRHDVLGTVETETGSDGDVADVLQDGYLLGDRVLRPAKVRISKRK